MEVYDNFDLPDKENSMLAELVEDEWFLFLLRQVKSFDLFAPFLGGDSWNEAFIVHSSYQSYCM